MQPQVAKGTADASTRTDASVASAKIRRLPSKSWSYTITSWLGLVPFLLFCLLFELLTAIVIIEVSFTDSTTGAVT
jgi:putative spermidine/putrescine transport system permease protein